MTSKQKLEHLDKYLTICKLENTRFIHVICSRYAVSERLKSTAIKNHTPYYSYAEMCIYFNGYIAAMTANENSVQ